MLRMTDLRQKDGRAHLGETVAETENKTTGHVGLPVRSEGRDESTSDHDDTTNGDGNLATPPFGGERPKSVISDDVATQQTMISYTTKKLAMEPMLYALFIIPRRLSSGLSKYAVHRSICCEEFIIMLTLRSANTHWTKPSQAPHPS